MVTAIQIFVVLLVLFNFFVLYMCAKRWRIVHVLATFLVFASAIAFVFFATISLKNRVAWQKQVQARLKELEKERLEEHKLRYGDLDEDLAKEKLETTLLTTRAAIEREQYDRGRIWTGCSPGRFDGRTVPVTTSTPDPAAPADAPVKANQMKDKMILFAFKEREMTAGDGFKQPFLYLGEFVATGVTETSVNLAATLPLDTVQMAALNTADGSTWALYEVLPVDSHEAMRGYLAEDGFKEFTRDQLKAILGTDEKKIIDDYDYNLKSISQIQAIDKDFSPPPDRVWFKLKFLKPYAVDVDSADPPAIDKTTFDTGGRALPLGLRQGEKTNFTVGEIQIFDQDSARQLITDGTCEKLDEVFVRSLHNYEHHFHEIDKRIKQLAEHMAVVAVDTANLTAARVAAQKQVDYRQSERDKAATDLTNVLFEQTEVTNYRLALEAALVRRKAELSEMYRTNLALAAELAAIQQRIAADLNKPAAETALESISVPALAE